MIAEINRLAQRHLIFVSWILGCTAVGYLHNIYRDFFSKTNILVSDEHFARNNKFLNLPSYERKIIYLNLLSKTNISVWNILLLALVLSAVIHNSAIIIMIITHSPQPLSVIVASMLLIFGRKLLEVLKHTYNTLKWNIYSIRSET